MIYLTQRMLCKEEDINPSRHYVTPSPNATMKIWDAELRVGVSDLGENGLRWYLMNTVFSMRRVRTSQLRHGFASQSGVVSAWE